METIKNVLTSKRVLATLAGFLVTLCAKYAPGLVDEDTANKIVAGIIALVVGDSLRPVDASKPVAPLLGVVPVDVPVERKAKK